ncbi:cytochrome c3 family protein, partial [Propionivibrio sp.]|uniref:cytochrome c3 family protein n=1 Tax=Propionivibrio sp. TaxID=2212460 RepID=UPI0026206F87
MRSLLTKLLVVLTGLLIVGTSHAQAQDKTSALMTPELLEKIRRANNECFACHSTEGYKNPPKTHATDMDLAKLRTLIHEPNIFNGSNHGLMECKQCHGQGYVDFPHAADARSSISPCEECHAAKVMKVEQQFEASVHAKNLKDKFTCSTCHSPHVDLIASKLIDPKRIVAQDNRHCLACHDSDREFAKFAPDDEKTSLKKERPNIDELHEWLPNTRAHWKAVRCVECHTPAGKTLSHEILNKDKAEKKCLACHSANSSLNTRLYRHLAKEEHQRLGFANSVILSNSYVLGATRHPLIDTLLMIAFGAMLLG